MDDLDDNPDMSCYSCDGDGCDDCEGTGIEPERKPAGTLGSYERNASVSVGGEEQ